MILFEHEQLGVLTYVPNVPNTNMMSKNVSTLKFDLPKKHSTCPRYVHLRIQKMTVNVFAKDFLQDVFSSESVLWFHWLPWFGPSNPWSVSMFDAVGRTWTASWSWGFSKIRGLKIWELANVWFWYLFFSGKLMEFFRKSKLVQAQTSGNSILILTSIPRRASSH